jgi:hypothetical protein
MAGKALCGQNGPHFKIVGHLPRHRPQWHQITKQNNDQQHASPGEAVKMGGHMADFNLSDSLSIPSFQHRKSQLAEVITGY